MKVKGFIGLFIALAIIAICNIVNAVTVDEYDNIISNDGKWRYTMVQGKDNEIRLEKCEDRTSTEITIPETIDGYTVTQMDGFIGVITGDDTPPAYKVINIPKTINEISYDAFRYCTNLEKINVASDNDTFYTEDGVLFSSTKKQLVAFPANKQVLLGKYSIPIGITSIYNNAFAEAKLDTVVIPTTVSSINTGAFFKSEISYINIPSTVEYLGSSAFAKATNLERVVLPSNLKTLSVALFQGCTSLKTLELPDSIEKLCSYSLEGTALTSLELPKHLKIMETAVFDSRTKLTKLIIPSEVYKIEQYSASGKESIYDFSKNPDLVKQSDGSYIIPYVNYTFEMTKMYEHVDYFLKTINKERKETGFSELKTDDVLVDYAMQRALECIINNNEETRPDGTPAVKFLTDNGYMYSKIEIYKWNDDIHNFIKGKNVVYESFLKPEYNSCAVRAVKAQNGEEEWFFMIFDTQVNGELTKKVNEKTQSTIKIAKEEISLSP